MFQRPPYRVSMVDESVERDFSLFAPTSHSIIFSDVVSGKSTEEGSLYLYRPSGACGGASLKKRAVGDAKLLMTPEFKFC